MCMYCCADSDNCYYQPSTNQEEAKRCYHLTGCGGTEWWLPNMRALLPPMGQCDRCIKYPNPRQLPSVYVNVPHCINQGSLRDRLLLLDIVNMVIKTTRHLFFILQKRRRADCRPIHDVL